MAVICPKCSYQLVTDAPTCPKCRIVFESYFAHLDRVRALAKEKEKEANPEPQPKAGLKIILLSLPVCFLIAILANSVGITHLLGWYFITIPIHEMGHALSAWLGGRPALPLGAIIPMAGVTMIAQERSLAFRVFEVLILSYLGSKAIYKKNQVWVFLISLYVFGFALMNLLVSESQLGMIITMGGVAGEFVLSTFMVISFYYDLGKSIRWDFFRFFILLAGSFGFTSTAMLWDKIARGSANLPLGSFLNGPGDESGDIDKLIMTYGWMPRGVVGFFQSLSLICLVVIFLHYVFFALKSLRARKKS